MAEFNFDRIKNLNEQIVRLMLYNDLLLMKDLSHTKKITRLPKSVIYKTKCCFTTSMMMYLLSFVEEKMVYNGYWPYEFEMPEFNPSCAYVLDLVGLSEFITEGSEEIHNTFTSFGHIFTIINNGGKWYIVDSFIGQKEMTKQEIDICHLKIFIENMRADFNNDEWNKMFSVEGICNKTVSVYAKIHEYKWSNTVNERLQELAFMSKNKFVHTMDGVQDKYLGFLDKSKNLYKAKLYLNRMIELFS